MDLHRDTVATLFAFFHSSYTKLTKATGSFAALY